MPSIHPIDSDGSDGSLSRRVSPFGDLRIEAYLRLPAAFRSWSRPSSANGALASTLCSSLLDFLLLRPFYLFCLRLLLPVSLPISVFRLPSSVSASAFSPSTGLPEKLISLQCAVVKVRWFSFLKRTFRAFTLWWVAMDSNHRPLAYQASALTS